jgi:thioredoxin-dependent peroxiredoxin
LFETIKPNSCLTLFKSIAQKMSASKVTIGSTLPHFELPDQTGALFNPHTFVGQQPLVIYFYPKDDTPGCTAEACSFRDAFEDFEAYGAKVIGISADTVEKHASFAKRYRLPFTLLADSNNQIRKLFQVPTNLFGLLSGRVTYIFDYEGKCRHIFNSQFNATQHIPEALAALKTIKKVKV